MWQWIYCHDNLLTLCFLFHKDQQNSNKILLFPAEHFKRDPVENVSMTSLEPHGNYRNEAREISTATANLRPAKLGFRKFYPTIKTDASNSWCIRWDCIGKVTRKSCQWFQPCKHVLLINKRIFPEGVRNERSHMRVSAIIQAHYKLLLLGLVL